MSLGKDVIVHEKCVFGDSVQIQEKTDIPQETWLVSEKPSSGFSDDEDEGLYILQNISKITVFVDNFASIYLDFFQMTKVFMGPKPSFIRMWMLAKIQMMTLKKFRQNGDKFGWMTIFQTLPLPFLRPVPK